MTKRSPVGLRVETSKETGASLLELMVALLVVMAALASTLGVLTVHARAARGLLIRAEDLQTSRIVRISLAAAFERSWGPRAIALPGVAIHPAASIGRMGSLDLREGQEVVQRNSVDPARSWRTSGVVVESSEGALLRLFSSPIPWLAEGNSFEAEMGSSMTLWAEGADFACLLEVAAFEIVPGDWPVDLQRVERQDSEEERCPSGAVLGLFAVSATSHFVRRPRGSEENSSLSWARVDPRSGLAMRRGSGSSFDVARLDSLRVTPGCETTGDADVAWGALMSDDVCRRPIGLLRVEMGAQGLGRLRRVREVVSLVGL